MKTTLRIAVIAAGFAVAAWPSLRAADESAPAQPTPTPPPPAAGGDNAPADHPHRGRRDGMEQLEHLKQALALTPQQCDQIKAIIQGNAPQRQAVMQDDSLSRHEKRARMQALKEVTRSQIRAVLTPEQQQKFDAMPRGPEGRNGGHDGGNPPPPPPSGGAPAQPGVPPAPANPPAGGNT